MFHEILGCLTIFGWANHLRISPSHQANSASYPQTGNEYQSKCGDALRQGLKAGMVHSTCG